jgi:hypothetical protein
MVKRMGSGDRPLELKSWFQCFLVVLLHLLEPWRSHLQIVDNESIVRILRVESWGGRNVLQTFAVGMTLARVAVKLPPQPKQDWSEVETRRTPWAGCAAVGPGWERTDWETRDCPAHARLWFLSRCWGATDSVSPSVKWP